MKSTSLLLFLTAAVAQSPTSWTPEYSLQVQNVTAVVPSPDGQVVAYVQSKPKVEGEHSEQISQIYIARSDGSRRLQLTRDEKGANAPAFSPDGRYVYFTSARPEDRKSTRLNSSHQIISYAVFCLKKKKQSVTYQPKLSAWIYANDHPG